MKKESRKINLVIDSKKQPNLYEQLERIDNHELQKGTLDFSKSESVFISKEDYLDALVKLDKAINGDHIIDFSRYSRGKSEREMYYDYRKVNEYQNIPLETLNYILLENIESMDRTFKNLYKEFPLELTNAFLTYSKVMNASNTLVSTKSFDVTDEEHKYDIWEIPNKDNFTKLYYYFGLAKRALREISKRKMPICSVEKTTTTSVTDKFLSLLEDVQKSLDELCGSVGSDEGDYINSEYYIYKDKLLSIVQSSNKEDLDTFVEVIDFKCTTYLTDNENEMEIKANTDILELKLEISKMYLEAYSNELKEGIFKRFDPFHFNKYLEYVVNYYSNYDMDYWLNKNYSINKHNDKEVLLEILEKYKDITPYANKIYKSLIG